MPHREPHGLNGRSELGLLRDSRLCSDGYDLFCDEAWAGIAKRLRLSSRQVEVVRRVLADQNDEEIASSLGLERATVRTHMERLHEKLGTCNRLQLATRIILTYRTWCIEAPPPRGCPLQDRLARV